METYTITLDAHDLDVVRVALHKLAERYDNTARGDLPYADHYRARARNARELLDELPITRSTRATHARERRAEVGRALARLVVGDGTADGIITTQQYLAALACADAALAEALAEIGRYA